MSFYVSRGDCNESSPAVMYANNRRGFGAKRIPRKAKKRLLKEWRYWRGELGAGSIS
jgi:hypothetical protein